MANQQNSYTGSQGTGTNNADFAFTFPSFTTGEVKVEVDNVVKTLTTHYTVEDYNTTSGGKVRFTTNNIPSGTTPVRIFRQTDVDSAKATFTAGSSLKAGEINDNFKQLRHALQEAIGAAATDRKVQRFNIEADTIDGTLIADDVINSEHYVAGSIDHEHLANDIIDGDNIQDDVINSEHYAAGSIDEEHIANSAVTQNKLANNSVGTPELINGSVTTDKLADDNVTLAKLGGGALPTDITVASANIVNGTIVTADIGNDQITNAKIADNSVNADKLGSGAVTTAKILNGSVTGSKLAQNSVGNNALNTNAVATENIQNNAVTAAKIADEAIVTSSEQASHSVNNSTFFTTAAAEARYFNASTGETIKDGQTFPDNDTTIATTAAINDRIIDLVDDVGGFVPIANETSFPTANPDVNNGAGTLVSIKEISSTRTPSTGTVTIANGSGSNTVTITGCGSTVLTAGFGVIVETTTTLHTYAFHRLVPKATEVTTVAGISSNVTTVATNIADINTVAADLNEGTSEIDTVATNIANVNNVGNSIANVNTTAGSIANVNTTAGSIANVNNVGNNISNVNSVAGNASNINSAVSNASNINSAVSNASNINTVAGSISNVNTTAGSISNVNTVASNINNVNSFFNTYRIGANNPTTSLDVGDLFFNTTANSLKVYTGSAWVDGVTATGNFAVVTGNTFTGTNNHNDGVKSIYGTGSDLHIFHDSTSNFNNIQGQTGSNTRIRQQGNGAGLYLAATNVYLQNHNNNETYLYGVNNGAVSLYYDNSVKFATTSTGVNVTGGLTASGSSTFNEDVSFIGANSKTITFDKSEGHIRYLDNAKAQFGTQGDLSIYHNGSHSFVQDTGTGSLKLAGEDVQIVNADNTAVMAQFISGGKNELRHDGSTKFETTSTGVSVTGGLTATSHITLPDDVRLKVGTGEDLHIYHNQSNSVIREEGTGNLNIQTTGGNVEILTNTTENSAKFISNGAVELYHNNIKMLETADVGVKVGDGKRYVVGDDSDGYLRYTSNTVEMYVAHAQPFKVNLGGETAIYAVANGAVELYYDNQKALKTTDNGILVYGHDGDAGHLYLYADDGDQLADRWVMRADASSCQFKLRNIVSGAWEESLVANGNGSTNLYYDNSLKLATTSYGSQVSGDLAVGANKDMYYDRGIHLSANGTGAVLHLTDNTSGHTKNDGFDVLAHGGNAYLFLREAGNMYFGTDSGNKWEITSAGVFQPSQDSSYDIGQNGRRVRNGYFDTLYGDGSNLTGINTDLVSDTSPQLGGNLDSNGNAILLGDTSDTNTATADDRIRIGASQDLQLFHGPNNSYIRSNAGSFNIEQYANSTLDVYSNHDVRLRVNAGEMAVDCSHNGSVDLYYDNTAKAATASHGMYFNEAYLHHHVNSGNSSEIRFTTNGTRRGSVYADNGNTVGFLNPSGGWTARWHANNHISHVSIVPNTDNAVDLGSTSKRWRNLFTGDLHMSNKGSSNDVDGSWGDWTFQEGESDLFLKNNRSGKQYKLNLTEVS